MREIGYHVAAGFRIMKVCRVSLFFKDVKAKRKEVGIKKIGPRQEVNHLGPSRRNLLKRHQYIVYIPQRVMMSRGNLHGGNKSIIIFT
jgi:hypothetical protein